MKQILLTTAILVWLSHLSTLAQPARIFVYSPGERDGLHVAISEADGWQDAGQLCASDYGQWGSEKRMYHPSVVRATDGTWRLAFQVNSHSPLVATAYSRDLLTWRPQDYPIVSSGPCKDPLITPNGDGSFSIHYKTKNGKRSIHASADFRRFTKDTTSTLDDKAWLRDTATVGGKLMEGCLFEVTDKEIYAIRRHFATLAEDARRSSERMHDDAKTMSGLQPLTLTLTVTPQEKRISDMLIGIFFEDISYAADGGLYAEMVQNRDFEYNPRDHKDWNATTSWHSKRTIKTATDQPLSKPNAHYAILRDDTISNEGWDGMVVEKGKKYDFSIFINTMGQKKNFTVRLIRADGSTLAEGKVRAKGKGWRQYSTVLTAKSSDSKAMLQLIAMKETTAHVDMVSLFPQETFMNRKNGLRRDLAEVIAALKPRFVRFPGGCMSHGQGLDNIYHWQHTIGPLWERQPDMNIWHYHQTRGLGFYEYFQFCEDIGAEPLPVLAAGVPCQNSANNSEGIGGQQGGIPMEQMPAYIEELLNLIEWANGDPATSAWAKKRAEAGHPAPFNLKYIGIGNEDIISTAFEERYKMICEAIRKAYPDIKICGTAGPFHTPSADYIEGWDFTRRNPQLQDLVDEHYYESTGWFLNHQDYYDHYDRSLPKVYLGEWAASTKTRRPNLETALAEALYLTHIERNGDVVEMTSYAPMLCKDGHHNWDPDMIYFSNTEIRPTPAYDIQRLFATYSGDRYITTHLSPLTSNRIGASLVRDSRNGTYSLKLINALPTTVTLQLKGIDIPASAKAEGFEGKPEDSHLTIKSTTVSGNNVTLPPYSMRVVSW